jgi:hypothetical protein
MRLSSVVDKRLRMRLVMPIELSGRDRVVASKWGRGTVHGEALNIMFPCVDIIII